VLSSCSFDFNLRRYSKGKGEDEKDRKNPSHYPQKGTAKVAQKGKLKTPTEADTSKEAAGTAEEGSEGVLASGGADQGGGKVGQCRLTIKPMLKAPETKRLKLKSDELLSNFAFKFNMRRSSKAGGKGAPKLMPRKRADKGGGGKEKEGAGGKEKEGGEDEGPKSADAIPQAEMLAALDENFVSSDTNDAKAP
jgi:hypothetical protein